MQQQGSQLNISMYGRLGWQWRNGDGHTYRTGQDGCGLWQDGKLVKPEFSLPRGRSEAIKQIREGQHELQN